MLKKAMITAALLASAVAADAQAQYASVEQDKAAKEVSQEQALDAARQAYMGRRFWIEPNPKAISRQKFIETLGDYFSQDSEFVVTEPTTFVVSGFVNHHHEHLVQVTFEDGKIAYLKEHSLFYIDPKQYGLFSDLYSLKEPREDWKEYILPMSPSDLRAALSRKRKKDAAAAAAWKARGGVSIGMTAEQVRKSNWGNPRSVNRTTGTYGVHEQWVYGDGNYIYLENGRVTAIQN